MTILVTGAAGFIGAAVCGQLLSRGDKVIGIDNLNAYYDTRLKKARLERIRAQAMSDNCQGEWEFHQLDIANDVNIAELFAAVSPQKVVHLAAQAGVRYSIEKPDTYVQSNVVGMAHLLEGCRHQEVQHLIYASSSSVYGGNRNMPFSEQDPVNHPVSLYAATKKANELMAHTYSHLYGLPATGLRFFTVYGPWGRPDMAPMLFAQAILSGKPIRVFNHGNMQRDFTYIDDIVEGVIRCLDKQAIADPTFNAATPNASTSWAPHRVFNIGNAQPTHLLDFIKLLEQALDRKAIKQFEPMQPGDVSATAADTSALEDWIDFRPTTPIEEGIIRFTDWFKQWQKQA